MDTDLNVKTNKTSSAKKILLFIFVFLLVGNISFYLKERSKWIYEGQPYPKAKEWLIPANMMLVYGTTLTKLPFVDERSWIMKPIIGLQDYFVSKWQENLPDDDAEKYLGWYIFRLRTYIVPNSGGVILYGNQKYSFDEVIKFNNEALKTIEAMTKYEAKDQEFNEIRYAAFNNLSASFISNYTAYWIHNPVSNNPDYVDQALYRSITENRYLTSGTYVDLDSMRKDNYMEHHLFKLYDWIYKMNNIYANRYPEIFQNAKQQEAANYWENSRLHELTNEILYVLIDSKKYINTEDFCRVDKNKYLSDYLSSKQWLLQEEEFLKTKGISLEKTLSSNMDKDLVEICPNLKISKE